MKVTINGETIEIDESDVIDSFIFDGYKYVFTQIGGSHTITVFRSEVIEMSVELGVS